MVVCGEDGLDEVTLAGPTAVTEVGGGSLSELTLDARGFWPARRHRSTRFAWPARTKSAAMIRQVLSGAAGAARDVVVLNAAAGLWTAGRSDSPRQAAEKAAAAIDSGAAARLLAQLAKATQR